MTYLRPRTGNNYELRWSKLGPSKLVGDKRYLFCKCSCGIERWISESNLKRGESRSCGCLKIELRGKRYSHKTTKYPKEYMTWRSIRYRVKTTYKARKIKVCERWQVFENFLADMGRCPSDKNSIDRINNDGNYEPGNCRWADNLEQANNQRKTILLTINGETKSLSDWARLYKIPRQKVYQRIRRGLSPIDALTKES